MEYYPRIMYQTLPFVYKPYIIYSRQHNFNILGIPQTFQLKYSFCKYSRTVLMASVNIFKRRYLSAPHHTRREFKRVEMLKCKK